MKEKPVVTEVRQSAVAERGLWSNLKGKEEVKRSDRKSCIQQQTRMHSPVTKYGETPRGRREVSLCISVVLK